MRTGTAIKAAVEITLAKTWAAAKTGRTLGKLVVRFSGEGAYTKGEEYKGNLSVLINLPDFKDDKVYSNDHADRIVAYALHELGHQFFTDMPLWTRAVESVPFPQQRTLHRCINAFEDVREEALLVTSGYAVGARTVLTALVKHLARDVTSHTFSDKCNLPFAICLNGRGYGTDVSALVPDEFRAVFDEGVMRCAGLKTTQDAIDAGRWLAGVMAGLDQVVPPQGEGQEGEQGEEGEGEGEGQEGEGEGQEGEQGEGQEGEQGEGQEGEQG